MADPPHNDIDNAPPGDPPLPPAPRIPRTHTSPGVIAAFKALSFGAKLKKCKEIEEQNDARMLQSMKHFEDPATFPDDGSEQASIFTLDPEDVRKLKVSSFAALFHSVMPSFIANFLAEEKIAEDDLKVLDKRGRDDNMSPEDMRLAKRRCMDGSGQVDRILDIPAEIQFSQIMFDTENCTQLPLPLLFDIKFRPSRPINRSHSGEAAADCSVTMSGDWCALRSSGLFDKVNFGRVDSVDTQCSNGLLDYRTTKEAETRIY